MQTRRVLATVARTIARNLGLLAPEVVRVDDEYLRWLAFANAGMLDQGNLHCFDLALGNLPSSAPMLEIGSFCGLSTNIIAHYKARHRRSNRLITCDAWRFEGAVPGSRLGSSQITYDGYRAFVKDTFKRNVGFFSNGDLPFTIEVTSDEFFRLWKESRVTEDVFGRKIDLGGTISFAFIDGNHSYEFARRDFENCDSILERRGFLFFDDSADDSNWEVKKVVQEALANGGYAVAAKNPNYLLQKA